MEKTELEVTWGKVREKQLEIFTWFFTILFSIYVLFTIICAGIYGGKLDGTACFNECSVPTSNGGAMYTSIRDLLTLLSIEIYFFVFWFVPRKFKLSVSQIIQADDSDQL